MLVNCSNPLCLQAIKDEDVHLNVDLMHMFAYDPELYEQLVAYPGEVIPLLDVEAREIAEDLHGEPLPENQLLTVQCLQCMHCILTLLCCAYKLSKTCKYALHPRQLCPLLICILLLLVTRLVRSK